MFELDTNEIQACIINFSDSFGGSDNRFEEETPQTYCLRILQKTTGRIFLNFRLFTFLLSFMIQGYSLFGHCCMLVVFVLSLVLIVALMYYMVSPYVDFILFEHILLQD